MKQIQIKKQTPVKPMSAAIDKRSPSGKMEHKN